MDDGGLFARSWEAKLAELTVRRLALSMGLAFIILVVLVVGLLGWTFMP